MKTWWGLLVFFVIFSFGLSAQEAEYDPALYAVGSLSAGNLYLSYLVLGTVADGYAQGLYDATVATSIVSETIFLNSNAQTSLVELLEQGNLSDEDLGVIANINRVYDLLTNQGEALIRFISDPEDTGDLFQQNREAAWVEISSLLGC